MTRSTLRALELAAMTLIAIASLSVAGYMVYLGRTGEAFGSLIGIVPLCINRIGNLGQSSAMQSMADHLAASRPTEGETKAEDLR